MVDVLGIINIIVFIAIIYFILKERKANEQNISLRIDRLKMLRIFSVIVLILLIIFEILIGIMQFGWDEFIGGIGESFYIYTQDEKRQQGYNIPEYEREYEYRQSEIGQLTRWICINIIAIPSCIALISLAINSNKKIVGTVIEDYKKQ